MNRQRVYQSRYQSKSSGIEVSGVLQRRGAVRSASEQTMQSEEETKNHSWQESPLGKNFKPVPVRSLPKNEVNSPARGESGLKRSFVNVPVHGNRLSTGQRSPLPLQQFQQHPASALHGEMGLVQRAFSARNHKRMTVPPIQAKLTIGQPNDKYEQEADQVATWAVQQINAPASSTQSPQGQSVQRQAERSGTLQAKSTLQRQETPNKTGLPDDLKAGVENLSGYSLDDVRVHYNSSQPAQLQALAYTQGTDIHVAPGQAEHLPHEAWHVVQQMQERVKPTMQMKGVQINYNEGLEKEADIMGARANSLHYQIKQNTRQQANDHTFQPPNALVLQRVVVREHVKKLKKAQVNFNKEELLFTVTAPSGVNTEADVIFLERGNSGAGWNHLTKHLSEFEKYGVNIGNFQEILEKVVARTPDTTSKGAYGYVANAGKGNFTISVVISENGYIVTAHPYEMTASAYYGAIKKNKSTFVKLGGLAAYSSHQ